jgi:hypothetical protein
MQCLEPLLLKKQTVEAFQLAGGMQLLLQFVHVALGPLRFVLDSFACTVDSTGAYLTLTLPPIHPHSPLLTLTHPLFFLSHPLPHPYSQ